MLNQLPQRCVEQTPGSLKEGFRPAPSGLKAWAGAPRTPPSLTPALFCLLPTVSEETP